MRGSNRIIKIISEDFRSNPQKTRHRLLPRKKRGGVSRRFGIGPAEANAIAVRLQGISRPRPLTHDLMYSIISALSASIDMVLINEIRGDTFWARILLHIEGRDLEIDSRPSDAIALALRAGVPIYIEDSVLDSGGMTFDSETGRPVITSGGEEERQESRISEEELKKLSAFRDFFEQIDPDDPGKKDD